MSDRLALIVVANPNPDSLSHAMARAATHLLDGQGYRIASHDLYAEKFDPVQPTGEQGNVSSPRVRIVVAPIEATRGRR